jgi:hypothetical protein
MNPRIRKLVADARDSLAFGRFVRHCQMEGLGTAQAEHDRLYTESQQEFFKSYEAQMDPMLYALAGIVGVEE